MLAAWNASRESTQTVEVQQRVRRTPEEARLVIDNAFFFKFAHQISGAVSHGGDGIENAVRFQ